MGPLTGLLYGALAIFLGGWYLGKWTGNFSLLLFILTLVTLAFWLAKRFHFHRAVRSPPAPWTNRTPRAATNSPSKALPRSTAMSRMPVRPCCSNPGGSTGRRACFQ